MWRVWNFYLELQPFWARFSSSSKFHRPIGTSFSLTSSMHPEKRMFATFVSIYKSQGKSGKEIPLMLCHLYRRLVCVKLSLFAAIWRNAWKQLKPWTHPRHTLSSADKKFCCVFQVYHTEGVSCSTFCRNIWLFVSSDCHHSSLPSSAGTEFATENI